MIKSFDLQYAFLSNFYNRNFSYQGQIYITAEHAFQAAKTNNKYEKEVIRKALTPGQAKRLGRNCQLRKDWELVKDNIMKEIVYEKFIQNSDLLQRLTNTGTLFLEEGNNWHDKYWGICYCLSCGGQGKNKLGKILMQIREELKI